MPSIDAGNVTVWISDREVEDKGPQLMKEAREFYPDKSSVDALAAVLSTALFECLDSLPEGAKNIEFQRGMFFVVVKDGDEPLKDWVQ